MIDRGMIGGVGLGRRRVLSGFAALGGALLLPGAGSAAPGDGVRRIDVHHHITPPTQLAVLTEKKLLAGPAAGLTLEKALADMDKAGVATAITSVVGPGVWFGDDEQARKLARECNDYAAKRVADQKGRFGMWACLPMPDIDGSLKEIAYALDTLKADGIVMWTNYGDKWLGDPAFAPVYEELNRRKAVVYTHPKSANCCGNLEPGVPDPLVEYGADTTRAIARMVFAGTAARYPDMRMIFSHAGGAMPFLIERFDFQESVLKQQAEGGNKAALAPVPNGVRHELRRFYYDTAQSANPVAMSALRQVVPLSQIVFGTDFPYRTSIEHVEALQKGRVFDASALRAVYSGNIGKLLPRYRS